MNTDIELDYKQELFSLIDRLSGHIKFACEDMEAKTRPELKNCTYAILYDKFITFLEKRLNKDDFLKLTNITNFNKHINYKKLLFDSINKNQSECDKQDLYAVFKILEKELIKRSVNADANELAQKYGIKNDIDKEEEVVKYLVEDHIESMMNDSYKELYTKYMQCLGSYVDFKVSLSRSADLIFYRNTILSRNEKWDELIENEREKVYEKVLPLIKEGFSQHKGSKILPTSLTTDLNEQINIANEIADGLKDASFSHKVLKKLSKFYKDLGSLNKINEKNFKATSIDIKCTTADDIKLTSPIMLNVLCIEFKHFAQVGIFPNYKDDTIKKLGKDFVKAEDQYPKLAATIIKNIFNKHGVFTKQSKNNKYGIKDKNGNLRQLPDYVAVMIYEILAKLGLCIADTKECKTFEDDPLRRKKEMARKFLQDESNDFGSIDVKQLFSDYNKFLIWGFAKESEKNSES